MTNWLFFNVVYELKLAIAVSQIQVIVSAGSEPGILEYTSGVLTFWPHCLHYVKGRWFYSSGKLIEQTTLISDNQF